MDFIRITIIDVIDIVLVAMIIYYVYKLIRGTHATSIISGIFLIYIIWIVVRALKMELLTSIIGSVTSIGILALVIIFQPELRRFLQVLGSESRSRQRSFIGRIFAGKRVQGLDTAYISPLVMACSDMADTKTGALIVIKQEGDLTEIVNTGVMIDAVLSTSLIKNIFFKNSPLHDGAVIIDEGRIVAAKCVLPSTRSEVPLSFGMRHRAALGLSEAADAIVIVVSEETGKISMVHNGKINFGLSPTELNAEFIKLNELSKEQTKEKKDN